jgi:hypothetical protein
LRDQIEVVSLPVFVVKSSDELELASPDNVKVPIGTA